MGIDIITNSKTFDHKYLICVKAYIVLIKNSMMIMIMIIGFDNVTIFKYLVCYKFH
jgi:hypothetical protein